MTSVLWRVADETGTVPMPLTMTDGGIRDLLAQWWEQPRVFGCASAARQREWYVIAPSPSVFCVRCALRLWRTEKRCALCRAVVDDEGAVHVVDDSGVVFLAATCSTCEPTQPT